jgi:hypothetical protein
MSAKFKNDFFEDQKPPKAQPPKITVIKTPQTTAPLPPHAHTGRRIAKILTLIVFLLVLGLGGFLLVRGTNIANQIFVGEKTSFYNKVSQLVKSATGRDAQLKGESDNQINILLLGIGGEGHDGSYLSDTIILAQIKPEDKKASLTSIPRDYLADLGPISGQQSGERCGVIWQDQDDTQRCPSGIPNSSTKSCWCHRFFWKPLQRS